MNKSQIENESPSQIEALLRSIRPEPGETYRQRMEQAPWNGFPSSKNKSQGRKYGFAAAATAMLIIAVFLLATPAGKVLANEVLHFFSRSQGNILPAPTELIVAPLPSSTPEPSYGVALVPAELATKPTPTITPTMVGAPKNLSLAEAEAVAGFNLYEPLRLPRDYNLIRINYDASQQAVYMEYKSPRAGTNEVFFILQGKNLDPFEVGASAEVEIVPIGEYNVEFVRGSWFTPIGSKEQIWENMSETYFLRWEAGDVSIEMGFLLNETFMPAYLTRDEMLTLARGLVRCPSPEIDVCDGSHAVPGRQPTPPEVDDRVAYLNVAEVESLAGFDILEPGLLPEGISFSHVRFSPSGKFVWLEFGDFSGDLMHFSGPTLRISQFVRQSSRSISPGDYPPEAVESVVVNGHPGIITIGRIFTNIATPGQPTPSPIWQAGTGDIAVQWMTETMVYSISFNPGYPGSERLSKQNLIRIAESLR